MSPEDHSAFDLLRVASRAPHPNTEEAVLDAAHGAEWTRVLALARYHRVTATLAAHAAANARLAERLPVPVRRALGEFAFARAVDGLFLSSELALVGTALEGAGVPFALLKGASLADAYGGLASRPFVDNDLLIEPDDFSRLSAVVGTVGFRPVLLGGTSLRRHLWVHGECTFERHVEGRRSVLDVHTRALPVGYAYCPRVADVLAGGRTVAVAGAAVPAMSWEATFVFLCVQAMKDQWRHLRLASDVAEVGRMVRDWDDVERIASEGRVCRAVHVALLTAAYQVGGRFPAPLMAGARRDARATQIARAVGAAFPQRAVSAGRPVTDRIRLTIHGQDGARGVARYAGYVLLRRLMGQETRRDDPEPRGPAA